MCSCQIESLLQDLLMLCIHMSCVIDFLYFLIFTARVWTKVKELTAESVGKRVLVRARLHTTRGTGRDLVHVCVIKSIHSK